MNLERRVASITECVDTFRRSAFGGSLLTGALYGSLASYFLGSTPGLEIGMMVSATGMAATFGASDTAEALNLYRRDRMYSANIKMCDAVCKSALGGAYGLVLGGMNNQHEILSVIGEVMGGGLLGSIIPTTTQALRNIRRG